MTQCEKIMRHMQDHGSITPVEAMSEYGVMPLRFRSLIRSKQTEGKNRYGERVRYSVYSLEVTG